MCRVGGSCRIERPSVTVEGEPDADAANGIGHHYMASAGQYLATEAAHAILRAGGNAIDAGVAGGIALGVVHSDQVQFSGVAPMLIHLADPQRDRVDRGPRLAAEGAQHRDVHPRPQRHDPVGLQRTVDLAAPDAGSWRCNATAP